MRALLTAYKVLATVVGLSIITLIVIGVPLEHVHNVFPSVLPVGSGLQVVGRDIDMVLGTAHGFIYMAFLVVAFMLSLRAKWPISFTLVTLLCGTIPFLSFWAELRAIRRVESEHPDLVAA